MNEELLLCCCGCGNKVTNNKNRFLRGHATKGKSSWNKGIPWSSEIKKRLSDTRKGLCLKTFLGRKHSNDTKKKISDSWNINKEIRSNSISIATKGILRSQETKEKISIGHKGLVPWIKGKRLSDECRQRLSNIRKGKKLSEQTKLKIRLSHLEIIKKKFFDGEPIIPCIGKKEKELGQYLSFEGIQTISQFPTKCGYFIDYYFPDLNISIEFDERHHESVSCKKYDEKRQILICNELNCTFYRIKEFDWDNDKEKTITEVKSFIEQTIKEKQKC